MVPTLIGRVLSSEISAEAHPRGVLSRVVSSGFSCRVPQASPNPYLFPIAQSVKAQFLAEVSGLQSFEPQKEVSVIPPKSGKSWAKTCKQASKHYHTLLAGGLWPALTHPYKHGSRRDLWISSNSHQGKSSASHVVPPQRRVEDRNSAARPHWLGLA